MSKKIMVALVIICVLSISINIVQFNKIRNYNKTALNEVLTFIKDDVKEIFVMEGGQVISYNYEIEPEIGLQISNQLIISAKEKSTDALLAENSYGVHMYIFFKEHDNSTRFIKIIPQDDDSVFVEIKVQTKGKSPVDSLIWSVKSSWLSEYMKKVKKDVENPLLLRCMLNINIRAQ